MIVEPVPEPVIQIALERPRAMAFGRVVLAVQLPRLAQQELQCVVSADGGLHAWPAAEAFRAHADAERFDIGRGPVRAGGLELPDAVQGALAGGEDRQPGRDGH